jgi:hypothetical protein
MRTRKHYHRWTLVWHAVGRYIYRCRRCHELGYGVPFETDMAIARGPR